MLKQITKGLNHLHILGIVHGDLQPSNILISQPSGDLGPSLKLADFGLSHAYGREYDPNHTDRRFRPAFSEGWICLSDPIDEDGERELSSDIFPLGILYAFVAFDLQGSINSGIIYCKLKMVCICLFLVKVIV